MKKYWYFTVFTHCPMCGRESVYKERRYGQKPKDKNKRFKIAIDSACASYDVAMG